MFATLEEIKKACEERFIHAPPLYIKENQIGSSQKPPERSYHLVMEALPPITGVDQARALAELQEEIQKSGFKSKISTGKIQNGGNHIELFVEDKRQQKFCLGETVLFRSDLKTAPKRFHVEECHWDQTTKEFIYAIVSVDNPKVRFPTVSEPHLNKI